MCVAMLTVGSFEQFIDELESCSSVWVDKRCVLNGLVVLRFTSFCKSEHVIVCYERKELSEKCDAVIDGFKLRLNSSNSLHKVTVGGGYSNG